VDEAQGRYSVSETKYEPPSVDTFYRGAGGGSCFDMGRATLKD
jgi:hypothetical protein